LEGWPVMSLPSRTEDCGKPSKTVGAPREALLEATGTQVGIAAAGAASSADATDRGSNETAADAATRTVNFVVFTSFSLLKTQTTY
jgi:hypothetical protein